jgi:AraC family transcriptional regulator of adaptative response / DNA-3-methyladenine glycosylase II
VLTESFTIPFKPPYHWCALSRFLAARSIEGIEHVDGNVYERYFVLQDRKIKVQAHYYEQTSAFEVSIEGHSPCDSAWIIQQVKRVLDTEAPWEKIEPCLKESGFAISDEVKGIRIPGVWDIFEVGCRAILGQLISVPAAINLTNKLVANARSANAIYGFPQAQQISDEMIDMLGMPQSKKQTLKSYVAYMRSPDHVNSVKSRQIKGLLSIKGIGPWTTQYILMRGTCDRDVWMPGDLAIRKQLETSTITPEKAAPFRTYLTLCLWEEYMSR